MLAGRLISTSTNSYAPLKTFLWISGFLIILSVENVTTLSLDKLSLKHNELAKVSTEVIDDVKPQRLISNGNNDIYVLLPDHVNGIAKNTIDETELESGLNGSDMLMMETEDAPMMSISYKPVNDFGSENDYVLYEKDVDPEVTEKFENSAINETTAKIDDNFENQNEEDAKEIRNEVMIEEMEKQDNDPVETSQKYEENEMEVDKNSEIDFVGEAATTKPVPDVYAEAIKDIEISLKKPGGVDLNKTDALKETEHSIDLNIKENSQKIKDGMGTSIQDADKGMIDFFMGQVVDAVQGIVDEAEAQSGNNAESGITFDNIPSVNKEKEIVEDHKQAQNMQIQDNNKIEKKPDDFTTTKQEIAASQGGTDYEVIKNFENDTKAEKEQEDLLQNNSEQFEDKFHNKEEILEEGKIPEDKKVNDNQVHDAQIEENAMKEMVEEHKVIEDNDKACFKNKSSAGNENIKNDLNASEWKEEEDMVVEQEELKETVENMKAEEEQDEKEEAEEVFKVENMDNTRPEVDEILIENEAEITERYSSELEDEKKNPDVVYAGDDKHEDTISADAIYENIGDTNEKPHEAEQKFPEVLNGNQDIESNDKTAVENPAEAPENEDGVVTGTESKSESPSEQQQQQLMDIEGMSVHEVQLVPENNDPNKEMPKEEDTQIELEAEKEYSNLAEERDDIPKTDETHVDAMSAMSQSTESNTMLTTIIQAPKQQAEQEHEDQEQEIQKLTHPQEHLIHLESNPESITEEENLKPSKDQNVYQSQPETLPTLHTQSQAQSGITEVSQQLEQQKQQVNKVTVTAAVEGDQMPTFNVMDNALNYVNASFMNKTNNNNKPKQPEMVEENNTGQRLYEGAQVWRIVVQNAKDKRMADELRTKYDAQLWKEVKAEVDYLLKPNVLAEAEQHIRLSNLSRIVLIDNLQKVIEVENPTPEEIAQYQNRKGHRLTWKAYHRLDDIHGFFDYLAKTYPDICQVETIGYSLQKRPLKILKISNGNPGNPSIWIDGGMHAREWISPAAVTFIANQIVEGWDDMPDHMRSINWFIHAVANPDGYEYSHTTDRLWRKNMRSHGRQCPGVDLNRNFGYKWGGRGTSANPCSQTYRGNKAFSEPETFYISKFISNFPRDTFQAYLSFHSYGQYILYPWGYDYQLSADHADLDRVARQAGSIITKNSGVKYTVGASATTLYPAAGGSDDWAKGIAGIKYSYTIEMGDTGRYGFVLPADMIESNGNDAFTFVETVARTVRKQSRNNRKRRLSRRFRKLIH